VNRKEAFEIVESLLETEGRADVLAEVRRALQSLDTYETHGETMADVTRALLANEKTYRLVFSHELDPMSLFDPATMEIIDVNDSWLALYGYSRDEALAMKVTDVSAEAPETVKAVERLAPGTAARVNVRWHRSKDGTVFPVELTAHKLTLGGRDVMYAVMRDITLRHRAEAALARSEASFRALIESMPDGVIVHRDGAIVYMSPSARRMLGYTMDDHVVGAPPLALVHPDDRELVAGRIGDIVHRGVHAPLREQRLLRRDGSHVVVEVAALGTVFDGAPAILAIARDVSARKDIEAQLVMNDRLASLGRLSASVGHELNNPLAYVLGNVGFMERELARTSGLPLEFIERFASYVKLVGEGARRMRDIVHDLKTLARGDGQGYAHIDVHHLLDVCVNMAEHELRPRASVVKDYGDKVFVLGTEARLGQVFLNLLVNAAHAILPGAPEANEVRVAVRAEGDMIVVEISDTGSGIPDEYLDRIFEPFFTTKEGVGTGLGLSISHRIVTSARGTLTCEPHASGGTVFRVTLPSPDASAEASADAAASSAAGSTSLR
jgi:PAS domain S-box-containing protein